MFSSGGLSRTGSAYHWRLLLARGISSLDELKDYGVEVLIHMYFFHLHIRCNLALGGIYHGRHT